MKVGSNDRLVFQATSGPDPQETFIVSVVERQVSERSSHAVLDLIENCSAILFIGGMRRERQHFQVLPPFVSCRRKTSGRRVRATAYRKVVTHPIDPIRPSAVTSYRAGNKVEQRFKNSARWQSLCQCGHSPAWRSVRQRLRMRELLDGRSAKAPQTYSTLNPKCSH